MIYRRPCPKILGGGGNNMYQTYKIARDKAWEVLIECKINALPVNLAEIAKHYGIKIVPYSKSSYVQKLNIADTDGFSTRKLFKNIIYYNDNVENKGRIRFTIAHELGHCILGHTDSGNTCYRNSETDDTDDIEFAANTFARDILMPATVLHSLNVNSIEEISDLCMVSRKSAKLRLKRLGILNKRMMYNKHPLERQVHNNFKTYIKKLSDTDNI